MTSKDHQRGLKETNKKHCWSLKPIFFLQIKKSRKETAWKLTFKKMKKSLENQMVRLFFLLLLLLLLWRAFLQTIGKKKSQGRGRNCARGGGCCCGIGTLRLRTGIAGSASSLNCWFLGPFNGHLLRVAIQSVRWMAREGSTIQSKYIN
jgi:hypothetical protein